MNLIHDLFFFTILCTLAQHDLIASEEKEARVYHNFIAEFEAYQLAQTVIKDEHKKQVLEIHANGTPDAMESWRFIFAEPSLTEKARKVEIRNDGIDIVQPVKYRHPVENAYTFDPAEIKVSLKNALISLQKHNEEKKIPYSRISAYARRPEAAHQPSWSLRLYNNKTYVGTAKVDPKEAKIVTYIPRKQSDVEQFFGDLEEDAHDLGDDIEEAANKAGETLEKTANDVGNKIKSWFK